MAALTFVKLLHRMQRDCKHGDRKRLAQTLGLFKFDAHNSPRFMDFVGRMDPAAQRFFVGNVVVDTSNPTALCVGINGVAL
jgi:hypothetical protein